MATMRKPFGFSRGHVTQRATAAAFRVGEKMYQKSGGATPMLKEVARLYKESIKAE